MLTQRGEVLCSQDDDLLDNCVFRKNKQTAFIVLKLIIAILFTHAYNQPLLIIFLIFFFLNRLSFQLFQFGTQNSVITTIIDGSSGPR